MGLNSSRFTAEPQVRAFSWRFLWYRRETETQRGIAVFYVAKPVPAAQASRLLVQLLMHSRGVFFHSPFCDRKS